MVNSQYQRQGVPLKPLAHLEVNGLEPITSCLQSMRSTIELYPLHLDSFERTKGAGTGGGYVDEVPRGVKWAMPTSRDFVPGGRSRNYVLEAPPRPPTSSHSSNRT